MKRIVLVAALAASLAAGLVFGATPAQANSGHFITGGSGAPRCVDVGTQVACTGKVAGLGGTTFEITLAAAGIASVECTNPGRNVAPGQDTAVDVAGTTDPQPTPRNGQSLFALTSDDPEPLPATPTCPNPQWVPNIVDVSFTTATLTLLEDGTQTDQVVVLVQ